MRVYLTGGTGLVGSHTAELLRAQGHELVCLQRSGSDTAFLEALGCEVILGDVRDGPGQLAGTMTGCDAVIHAAALVHAGESWPRVRAVNVEGTSHVVSAAVRAGVPRMIHLSSVAVYGGAEGHVDESSPTDLPLPPSALYARSKREGEAAARAAVEEAGSTTTLTLLRPSAVYGERDRLLAPRVATLARLPVIPLAGDGDNTLPVVYAGNVAAAVEDALSRTEGPPRPFDVGLDHPLTQRDFLAGIARGLGRTPHFVSLPAGIVRSLAELGEALGVSMPGAGDLSLSRTVALSVGENPYRSRRIREELDWRPAFGHDEGMARTAAWLEARER